MSVPPTRPGTVAAVDLGGTKTAAALVDADGRVVDRLTAPTPALAGPAAVLDTVARLVRMLAQRSGPPAALGVGSAGVIDPVGGRVLGATDALAGWAGTDLRGGLATRTGLATAVVNDVHAHALGESVHGAAGAAGSLLLVAVGTGVGGAILLPGLPGGVVVGARAAAGHVGHVPSPHAGRLPCSCGGRGHLEAIASGPALLREHERRTSRHLTDLREVVALAADGDEAAAGVLVLGGTAVGAVIGGLVNVLDPDVVVVGGGVAGAGEEWWQALLAAVAQELVPALRDVRPQRSTLGPDAPLLGAAALAWRLVEDRTGGGGR